MKIYRFLGLKSNTTIPKLIRERLDLTPGKPISYELRRNGTIVIRPEEFVEKIELESEDKMAGYFDSVDKLEVVEQKAVLTHLVKKLGAKIEN